MDSSSIKIRLPKGDLYNRYALARKIVRKSKDNDYLHNFAQYFKEAVKQEYYGGLTSGNKNRKKIPRYFEVINDMIKIKDIYIPVPDIGELHVFEGEYLDLIMPYVVERFASKYNDFYVEGPYEINENVCVNNGDVVLDCGANMGMFTAVASHEAGNEGKVIAFEPSRFIINKYLSKTVNANGNNITIAPYAVSDQNGKMDMYINSNNIGASSLTCVNDMSDMTHETVDVIKLDDYVENSENNISKVSFIKADIEGAERYMLQGATRILKEEAPKLSICTYHFPEDPELLEKIILKANPKYIIEHKFKKLYAYCK